MRTSRDLLRPLAALLVVVAAVGFVANVAAYRAAVTPHRAPKPTTPVATRADDDHAVTPRADDDERAGEDRERRADRDGDGDARSSRSSNDGSGVVVTTTTGPS